MSQAFALAKKLFDTEGRAAAKGKIVILLTDGRPTGKRVPKVQSVALQKEGAMIFGIGVGPHVKTEEIDSWVSQPTSDHYFTVDAFADLDKILKQLVANACPHSLY